MKQAVVLLALVIAGLEIGQSLAGQAAMVRLASGAMAAMALMIAGTFLWLWTERATPLALGMAFSWAGAGVLAAAWWLADLHLRPAWIATEHAAPAVLGLCIVGAVLHFAVIHRSFGRHGVTFLWPVLAALALSAAGVALFGGL